MTPSYFALPIMTVRRRAASAVGLAVLSALMLPLRVLAATTPGPGQGLIVIVGLPEASTLAAVQEQWKGIVQVLVEQDQETTEINLRLPAPVEALLGEGRTSVFAHDGGWMPYCDNSVNRILVVGPTRIPETELRRVLAPRGELIAADGTVTTKPWPAEIDEWTHLLYDATNNAVANDTRVGPPDRLRWIGAPDHLRHHNFLASVSVQVSARGRLFTIVDEGSLVSDFLPPKWVLQARDAFNGVTLWKRDLTDWSPTLRNFRAGPAELGRRLVAVGDEVFVTLGFEAPVTVLDAATGETKAVIPGTEGTEEILVDGGLALVVTGSPKAEARDWAGIQRDFTTGAKHKRGLAAVDLATRKLLWKRQDEQTATVLPLTLATRDGRGFFVNGDGVHGFEARTGHGLWHTPERVALQRQAKFAPTVVVHDDVLLYADRLPDPSANEEFYAKRPKQYLERYRQLKAYPSRLRAYDAATGKRLWDCAAGESFHTPTDVLVVDDVVWYTVSPAMLEGNFKEGRDLHTGEIVKHLDGPDINHGRCYRNKATSQFLLGGKNGLDFIDPNGKRPRYVPRGLRATCQLGVLPCNGMVYLPPHACVCEPERKLNGFLAVSHGARQPYPDPTRCAPRLRRGPAYGQVVRTVTPPASDEWPTFRHEVARTGCSSTTLPDRLEVAWERPVGRRPTAPVCAGGRLYVAAREDHVLWALDATTGEPVWKYRTPARVDSPPTVASGLVVFGCRDGWLRCLRAEDGVLVWRFRGAPEERQLVAHEQLESVWPLVGSPLVRDGKVYFAAGRGSVIDGGVYLFCLDLFTAKVLARTRVFDEGRAARDGGRGNDALLDVLSFVDGRVCLRSLCLTPELKPAEPVAHLQSATGFLDDNFFHRSYWAFDKRVNRYQTGTQAASGFVMTIEGDTAYAYGRDREYYLGHVKGFERHLYSASLKPKRVKLDPGPQEPRVSGTFSRVIAKYAPMGIAMKWSTQVPVLVKGMTVAGDKLVVAGPTFELHPSTFLVDEATNGIRLSTAPEDDSAATNQIAAAARGLAEQESPRLCLVDKRTGEITLNQALPRSPVFDGLIAAAGRLYVCREDGVVACLGAAASKGRP